MILFMYYLNKRGLFMKRKMSFISVILSLMIISACSNNTSDNLMSMDSLTEGSWISYDGEPSENEEMLTTESMEYDPAKTYEINRASYVSYFNGEEFIKTVKYVEEPPMTLETVENADSIRVSFNQYNEDAIELKEAE